MTQRTIPEFVVERCLIAGDLHLPGDGSPHRLEALLEAARDQDADLILLGDVFHYWFGPKHLEFSMYERELAALRDATSKGTRIVIVPGNRDFLLDATFTGSTGVEVAGDYLDLRLEDRTIRLTHGDLFCTQDVHYQRMRRVLRSRMVLFLVKVLPGFVLRRIARRLREHSEKVVREKPSGILEPDLKAVATAGDRKAAVVCGHFHVLRDEELPVDGGKLRFLIVEPFEERGFVLRVAPDEWTQLFLG